MNSSSDVDVVVAEEIITKKSTNIDPKSLSVEIDRPVQSGTPLHSFTDLVIFWNNNEHVTSSEEVAEHDDKMPETDNNLTMIEDEETPSSAMDWVLDRRDDAADVLSDAIHGVVSVGETLFRSQKSNENLPENNVHMIHPETSETFGFGIHIVAHEYGCKIKRVIENGIAFRAKLKSGDVIHTVNGNDVRNLPLNLILQYFNEVEVLKTFHLVLFREQQQSDGRYNVVEIKITLTLTLSDDSIGFEIAAVITAKSLRYDHTTKNKYLKQTRQGASSKFLRMDGELLTMSIIEDGLSVFQMELYRGDALGRICVIRNTTTTDVIGKMDVGLPELYATNAPPADMKYTKPDNTHFYWKTINATTNENIFESVTQKDYYINVSDNETLNLIKIIKNSTIPSSCRFNVINCRS